MHSCAAWPSCGVTVNKGARWKISLTRVGSAGSLQSCSGWEGVSAALQGKLRPEEGTGKVPEVLKLARASSFSLWLGARFSSAAGFGQPLTWR